MSFKDTKGLRESILAKHPSIHAFCKKHKNVIARSTVYQILNNRYPGKTATHIAKIKDVLDGKLGITTIEAEMLEALKSVACAKCKKKGRKICRKCNQGMLEQVRRLKTIFDLAKQGDRHVDG